MKIVILTVLLWIGFSETKSINPAQSLGIENYGSGYSNLQIAGGEVVSPRNAYPFQAALNVTGHPLNFLCGASLIHPEWVLTAAHCLSTEPETVIVLLGAFDLTNPQESHRQIYQCTKFILHPQWDIDNFINGMDIALVKLPQRATLNDYVGLIKLGSADDTYAGKLGTLLGWGITETEGDGYTVLRKVVASVMSNDDCKAANPGVIQESHICTSGEGDKRSCSGDSGSPLIVEGVQVGITSFATAGCHVPAPSVFTRVPVYLDWIENVIKNNSAY